MGDGVAVARAVAVRVGGLVGAAVLVCVGVLVGTAVEVGMGVTVGTDVGRADGVEVASCVGVAGGCVGVPVFSVGVAPGSPPRAEATGMMAGPQAVAAISVSSNARISPALAAALATGDFPSLCLSRVNSSLVPLES